MIDHRQAHANFGALPQRNKCIGRAGRDTRKIVTEIAGGFIREENRVPIGRLLLDAVIWTGWKAITATGTSLQE